MFSNYFGANNFIHFEIPKQRVTFFYCIFKNRRPFVADSLGPSSQKAAMTSKLTIIMIYLIMSMDGSGVCTFRN